MIFGSMGDCCDFISFFFTGGMVSLELSPGPVLELEQLWSLTRHKFRMRHEPGKVAAHFIGFCLILSFEALRPGLA